MWPDVINWFSVTSFLFLKNCLWVSQHKNPVACGRLKNLSVYLSATDAILLICCCRRSISYSHPFKYTVYYKITSRKEHDQNWMWEKETAAERGRTDKSGIFLQSCHVTSRGADFDECIFAFVALLLHCCGHIFTVHKYISYRSASGWRIN